MRELLEAQCELLLSLRSNAAESGPERPSEDPTMLKGGAVA